MYLSLVDNKKQVKDLLLEGRISQVTTHDNEGNDYTYKVDKDKTKEIIKWGEFKVKLILPHFSIKEKEYINFLLSKYKGRTSYIIKIKEDRDKNYIELGLDKHSNVILLTTSKDMFECMDLGRKYRLSDLTLK